MNLSLYKNINTSKYEQEGEEDSNVKKSSGWFGKGKSKDLKGNMYFLEVRKGPVMLLNICTVDKNIRNGWDDAIKACVVELQRVQDMEPDAIRNFNKIPSQSAPPGRGATPPAYGKGPPGRGKPPTKGLSRTIAPPMGGPPGGRGPPPRGKIM